MSIEIAEKSKTLQFKSAISKILLEKKPAVKTINAPLSEIMIECFVSANFTFSMITFKVYFSICFIKAIIDKITFIYYSFEIINS